MIITLYCSLDEWERINSQWTLQYVFPEIKALKFLNMMNRTHYLYSKPFVSVVLDFCCNVVLLEAYEVWSLDIWTR